MFSFLKKIGKIGNMVVYEDLKAPIELVRPVITIGNFDGVHRGHVSLVKKVLEESDKINGTPCVLTFYPHPLTVLNPYVNIEQITPLEDKLELIEKLGIKVAILVKFDDEFSKITGEQFVQDILVKKIGVKKVIVGYDFGFGRNKSGSIDLLKQLGNIYGFDVFVMEPLKEKDRVISSTRIRGFIKEGLIKEANEFLGRPYRIKGMVVKGRKIGRLIGFPTANLLINNYLIPGRGVYAAYAFIEGVRFRAVVNVGPAPTFHINDRSFEVHLLDFDGDIYGKEMEVELKERLRGIEKFKDVEDLKLQIKNDIERARRILI